jgi:hypothetical protein
MKTRRTALSRIELLVVIVIIVLVPSILMASLEAARELAKIPVCANQLRQIGLAVSLYAESYEGRMPWWGYSDPEEESEEMHPYVAYRQDWVWPNRRLKAMRLACLYEAGLITEPKIFYCPANKNPLYMYESYMNPPIWGYLPQWFNVVDGHNQWVRVGYEYYPTDPNGEKNTTGIPVYTARRIDKLDSRIPYMTDVLRHRDELSHNIQDNPGVNALFKDGHVVYCDDRDVFDDPIWDRYTSAPWREYYYTIFKLIGQSCGPAE